MSTHIPTPTLALFVPLQPKSSALGDFLKAGRSLAVEEEGTLQWLALKYKGADTYAIFDTFPDAASRNAHMTGKIPDALMATAESLITQAPDMVAGQASILASKVHTPESGTLKCGLFVKINDTSDELKQFLVSALPLVLEEDFTPLWFAVEFAGHLAIVDFFESEEGKAAHLGGKVAAALMARGHEPEVIELEVIASK